MPPQAYIDGLKMLARRELSEAQVRIARRAVDEIFDHIEDQAYIDASLKKRLRGRETIADDRELQRLFRYLVGQGFESDRIMRDLTARRRRE